MDILPRISRILEKKGPSAASQNGQNQDNEIAEEDIEKEGKEGKEKGKRKKKEEKRKEVKEKKEEGKEDQREENGEEDLAKKFPWVNPVLPKTNHWLLQVRSSIFLDAACRKSLPGLSAVSHE